MILEFLLHLSYLSLSSLNLPGKRNNPSVIYILYPHVTNRKLFLIFPLFAKLINRRINLEILLTLYTAGA